MDTVDRIKSDALKPAERVAALSLTNQEARFIEATWLGADYVWNTGSGMAVLVDRMPKEDGFTLLDGSARLYRAWDGYLQRDLPVPEMLLDIIWRAPTLVRPNQLATLLVFARSLESSALSVDLRLRAVAAHACAGAALSTAEAQSLTLRMAKNPAWNYEAGAQTAAVVTFLQTCLNGMLVCAGSSYFSLVKTAFDGATRCAEMAFKGIHR